MFFFFNILFTPPKFTEKKNAVTAAKCSARNFVNFENKLPNFLCDLKKNILSLNKKIYSPPLPN